MNTQEPIHINEDSFQIAVTKSLIPVLVDFWAPWCGPCKMIAPILDEIAREKAGAVRVAKVNVEDNPQLAARFGVRNIPTLLVFSNGKVTDTVVGVTNAAKRTILEKLEAAAQHTRNPELQPSQNK
jgi:thioredoxin